MATEANGSPAVAQWRPAARAVGFQPWALHVLEVSDGRVAHISSFLNLDNELFQTLGTAGRRRPNGAYRALRSLAGSVPVAAGGSALSSTGTLGGPRVRSCARRS